MSAIKKPKNSLNYLKNLDKSCKICFEAKEYFKYPSKLEEHWNGGETCKNSSVRKGDEPSKEFEVNHMFKTELEAKEYFLQLTPNSTFSYATGGRKSVRKCKQHKQGCTAMLRMRKSDRFCRTNGEEYEIVSGYVVIGSIEHNNHGENVPLYAYCYERHAHEVIEKFYETLTAAKDEIKKLFTTYQEENGMNRRDHTIHYHCDDHADCTAWLRIVKVEERYLVRGCVNHSKKSQPTLKVQRTKDVASIGDPSKTPKEALQAMPGGSRTGRKPKDKAKEKPEETFYCSCGQDFDERQQLETHKQKCATIEGMANVIKFRKFSPKITKTFQIGLPEFNALLGSNESIDGANNIIETEDNNISGPDLNDDVLSCEQRMADTDVDIDLYVYEDMKSEFLSENFDNDNITTEGNNYFFNFMRI